MTKSTTSWLGEQGVFWKGIPISKDRISVGTVGGMLSWMVNLLFTISNCFPSFLSFFKSWSFQRYLRYSFFCFRLERRHLPFQSLSCFIFFILHHDSFPYTPWKKEISIINPEPCDVLCKVFPYLIFNIEFWNVLESFHAFFALVSVRIGKSSSPIIFSWHHATHISFLLASICFMNLLRWSHHPNTLLFLFFSIDGRGERQKKAPILGKQKEAEAERDVLNSRLQTMEQDFLEQVKDLRQVGIDVIMVHAFLIFLLTVYMYNQFFIHVFCWWSLGRSHTCTYSFFFVGMFVQDTPWERTIA